MRALALGCLGLRIKDIGRVGCIRPVLQKPAEITQTNLAKNRQDKHEVPMELRQLGFWRPKHILDLPSFEWQAVGRGSQQQTCAFHM